MVGTTRPILLDKQASTGIRAAKKGEAFSLSLLRTKENPNGKFIKVYLRSRAFSIIQNVYKIDSDGVLYDGKQIALGGSSSALRLPAEALKGGTIAIGKPLTFTMADGKRIRTERIVELVALTNEISHIDDKFAIDTDLPTRFVFFQTMGIAGIRPDAPPKKI